MKQIPKIINKIFETLFVIAVGFTALILIYILSTIITGLGIAIITALIISLPFIFIISVTERLRQERHHP